MKKIFVILLAFYSMLNYGQQKADTLQTWISKFYTFNNLTYSPDGRLATIKKWFANNLDTIVVVDTHKPHVPIGHIVKMPNQVFLDDSSLLSFGNGKAQHSNFANNRKTEYINVMLSEALVNLNQYFILYRDGTLKLYNTEDKEILKVTGVQKFVTDKSKALLIYRKNGKNNEVFNILGKNAERLYSTENEIKQLILSPSGKKVIVAESKTDNSKLSLTFIDPESKQIVHPEGILPEKADYIDVTEIKSGKAYFITFATRIRPPKNLMVDIWYGNDNNLQAKQEGTTEYKFWLWKPESKISVKPPTSYPIYHPIDDERYLLAFNPLEEFKNITLHPYLNIYLYDTVLNNYQEIFHQVTKDIVHSSNGRYILALDPKARKWIFYNINSKSSVIINKVGLLNPVFASDFKSIYFESDNDIWKYDTTHDNLQQTGIATSKEGSIVNVNRKITNPVFGFKMSMADNKSPLLIKIRDKSDNTTSYIILDKGRIKNILPFTSNRIKEIKYDLKLQRFATLEENFNMAPKLFITHLGKQRKKEVLRVEDKSVLELKQEVLSYTNSLGTALKGILYYPVNYNPAKKYPMVVYIYQIKSTSSNVYSVPCNEPTGVNRRTLLENGFFVYEPDIVLDSRGTGLSALDCVNNALDAIKTNPAINMRKIGLTGHSMGGYETNFIATHSDRFAAFVSGAGFSDIISSYHSYDYHEQKPNHTRFETGQYEMGKPFSEDKDLYFKNNPINYVANVKAPVLLWCGEKDDIVPSENIMKFFNGLKRNELTVVAVFYPKISHDLGNNTNESKDMSKRMLEWWNYFLKGKTDTVWIQKEIKRDAG